MKNILYSILAACLMAGLAACEDFLDINENPNSPSEVKLEQILPSTQIDFVAFAGHHNGGLSDFTSHYIQHITSRGSETNDYAVTGADFGVVTPWNLFYTRVLPDLNIIIEEGAEAGAWHYVGMAEIMKAYGFSLLVDVYGDVPFSEAGLGAAVLNPVYEQGAEIYPQLLDLLDAGIAKLDSASTLTPGNNIDLFHGADLEMWQKTARTWKLKMLNNMRLTANVTAEVQELLGQELLEEGEDFEFQYGTSVSPDNRHPGFVDDYDNNPYAYINPYFWEIMSGKATFFPAEQNPYIGRVDPRLNYYFYNQLSPTEAAENPVAYRDGGFLSIYGFSYNIDPNEGWDQASSQTIQGLYPVGGALNNLSGTNASFALGEYPSMPQRLLPYFNRKFIEAELALAGVSGGNARSLFEEAMQAAFAKVNSIAATAGVDPIPATDIADYIEGILAIYDAENAAGKLEQVMLQKWIANFGYGVDSYSDYRRTGFPILHDGNTDFLNVTVRTRDYPLSFPWPTDNLTINSMAPSQKVPSQYAVFWDR